MEPIEGKIAAILDKTAVVINRGFFDGVSKGQVFYVYSELGPFKDPDTGEDLGTIVNVWGRVVASNVSDRLCIARTEKKYVPAWDMATLGRIFEGREIQLELPVDPADISGWSRTVRVGSKVVSQPPTTTLVQPEEPVEPKALSAPQAVESQETTEDEGEDQS